MKNLKQEILLKMLEKHKTLSIKRQYFVRGKKLPNGFYEWNVKSKRTSLKDVESVLNKTQIPFDLHYGYAFAEGKINRLVIDNGDDCIEVSYA